MFKFLISNKLIILIFCFSLNFIKSSINKNILKKKLNNHLKNKNFHKFLFLGLFNNMKNKSLSINEINIIINYYLNNKEEENSIIKNHNKILTISMSKL
jgi:hypothetical protein